MLARYAATCALWHELCKPRHGNVVAQTAIFIPFQLVRKCIAKHVEHKQHTENAEEDSMSRVHIALACASLSNRRVVAPRPGGE